MTRKIVGTIFVLAGVALAAVLSTKGMFIFPHLTGPVLSAAIGVVLLTARNKSNKSAK